MYVTYLKDLSWLMRPLMQSDTPDLLLALSKWPHCDEIQAWSVGLGNVCTMLQIDTLKYVEKSSEHSKGRTVGWTSPRHATMFFKWAYKNSFNSELYYLWRTKLPVRISNFGWHYLYYHWHSSCDLLHWVPDKMDAVLHTRFLNGISKMRSLTIW